MKSRICQAYTSVNSFKCYQSQPRENMLFLLKKEHEFIWRFSLYEFLISMIVSKEYKCLWQTKQRNNFSRPPLAPFGPSSSGCAAKGWSSDTVTITKSGSSPELKKYWGELMGPTTHLWVPDRPSEPLILYNTSKRLIL